MTGFLYLLDRINWNLINNSLVSKHQLTTRHASMRLDTETRQRQIVQAAIVLIHHGGIQNLTIKKVAAEVGISEQAIYRHFDNKRAILTAIINFFTIRCSEILDEVGGIQSPLLQIRRFMEIHIEYFEENPAIATVIFSEEIFQNESSLAQKVKQLVDTLIQFVTDLVKKGQASGEISNDYPAGDLAFMILGSLRFLVTVCRLSGYSFSMKDRGWPLIETVTDTLKQK